MCFNYNHKLIGFKVGSFSLSSSGMSDVFNTNVESEPTPKADLFKFADLSA
jgi:hypothetical protein